MRRRRFRDAVELRRPAKSLNLNSHYEPNTGPVKLEHLSRLFIRVPAIICVSLFSWLKLKGISFGILTGDEYVEYIFRGTLVVWFWSWVLGTSLDARNQSIIYQTDPSADKNRLWESVGFMVALTLIFIVLCWVRDVRWFVLILAAFFVACSIGWRFLVNRFIGPMIEASLMVCRGKGNFLDYERVECYSYYINGAWRWWHCGCSLVLVSLLNVIVFSGKADFVATAIGFRSSVFFTAFSASLLLLGLEAWMWSERIRALVLSRHLELLNDTYLLTSKEPDKGA